jgi:mitochondrial fission protein ELM1
MPRLTDECWAITDGHAGNQRQALALAALMGLPVRHLQLTPRAPWSWWAPRFALGDALALPAAQRPLFAPPWPRLAIGCGRTAALFTRMLRRLAGGRCHTVQILDPRIDPAHWDTVIAPRHDRLAGANVLAPLGSLNPVDDDWLADGRDACPALGELPAPRVGVLLGGSRPPFVLDAASARALAARLVARHAREGGSLMVLASRRTPPAAIAVFRQLLAGVPGLCWAGPDDGRNPYPGVLGWADRLVVTPDSVNMLSEACAVGCAVHTCTDSPLPAKLARFHAALREAGLLHELDEVVPARQAALRETAAIARILRARMGPGDTRQDGAGAHQPLV